MSTHTPGPWEVDGPRIYTAKHELMATTGHRRDAKEEVANARLIAGAPSLLSALKDTNDLLVATFGGASDPDDPRHWSDKDAYSRYRRNCEIISKAERSG